MKTEQTVANSSIPETGVSSGGQADPLGDSEVKIQATHDATLNEPPSVVQEERQIQVDVVVPSEAEIAEAKLTIEADVAKILAGESAAISLT